MLSFRLLQDVQSYIDNRKINGREMCGSTSSDVKTEIVECSAEAKYSFAPIPDFFLPLSSDIESDEAEDKDEIVKPKASRNFRRAKKTGILSGITLNNPSGKIKDSMGVVEDESDEQTSETPAIIPCKRPENSIPSGYAGNMADVRRDITNRLAEKDESFSDYLIARIDEAGITDVDCYTRAQVSRQLFNKIKNTKDYRPSKATAIALGLALNLAPNAFNDLLSKAGYTLSNNNDFDLIVDYCVINNINDIDDINELLFSFDQPLLGSK